MDKNAKAAFHWIARILRKNKVPFRISGGLAANSYGSERELVDIDIDVPDDALMKLMPLLKKFKFAGPNHYKDGEWDVNSISIDCNGQDVDLIGADSQKIFNKNTQAWEKLKVNFSQSSKKKVFGLVVPVISKKELIVYKSKIRRGVDLLDVKALKL